MNNFPSTINVNNKKNFKIINYNNIISIMRKEIYDIIIKENENDYFDIDIFQEKYKLKNDDKDAMVKSIVSELEKIGWKTKLSFGDTGLFIYSSENPPPSCW